MSDQFGKQATFILPDGEKMTEMYLGIRDLETGKVKKALPSSYLVTAQRDPKTGKILRLISDKTETKHEL